MFPKWLITTTLSSAFIMNGGPLCQHTVAASEIIDTSIDNTESNDNIRGSSSIDNALLSPTLSSIPVKIPSDVEDILLTLEQEHSDDENNSTQEFIDATGNQYEQLITIYKKQIQALESGSSSTQTKNQQSLQEIQKRHMELLNKMQDLTKRTNDISAKVQHYNFKQLRTLQQRVKNTSLQEQSLRNKNSNDTPKQNSTESKINMDDYVTIQELEDMFQNIISTSQPWEQELEMHIQTVMDTILKEKYTPILVKSEKSLDKFEDQTKKLSELSKPKCTDRGQLKTLIKDTLYPKYLQNYQDYIPPSKIIYDSTFTSPTYTKSAAAKLSSMIGEPHAVIKDENTNLGSCWPMSMSNDRKGKITFLFPHPITVRSVVLHHVSPLLLTNEQRKIGTGSAPRFFHVQAYAPCDDLEEHGGCELGFKEEDNWTLMDGEYVWGKGVAQFYPIGGDTDVENANKDENEEEEEESKEDESFMPSGSCSMPPEDEEDFVPSCGGSGDDDMKEDSRPIQAITLVIDENSGNEDYTCLYRLQVFGKAV